jgi:predicted Zn-dependent peptidase
MGIMDSGSTAYAIGQFPPSRQISEYSPMLRQDTPADVNVTTLSNGVRILTETAKYPTSVFMGTMLDAGSRDETMDNAGVALALKNTFLKTNQRTNEQINYCMI